MIFIIRLQLKKPAKSRTELLKSIGAPISQEQEKRQLAKAELEPKEQHYCTQGDNIYKAIKEIIAEAKALREKADDRKGLLEIVNDLTDAEVLAILAAKDKINDRYSLHNWQSIVGNKREGKNQLKG